MVFFQSHSFQLEMVCHRKLRACIEVLFALPDQAEQLKRFTPSFLKYPPGHFLAERAVKSGPIRSRLLRSGRINSNGPGTLG